MLRAPEEHVDSFNRFGDLFGFSDYADRFSIYRDECLRVFFNLLANASFLSYDT
jgi:hypothetical protein